MPDRSRAVGVLATCILCATSTARADSGQAPPPADRDAEPRPARNGGRWSALPVVGVSPETSLLLGALAVYNFGTPSATTDEHRPGSDVRRSSMNLLAAYTLRNQFILSSAVNIYPRDRRWQYRGRGRASWFPDTLYELGRESHEDSAESYTRRELFGSVEVTRRWVRALRVGGILEVGHYRNTDYEAGGLIDSDSIPGSDGGVLSSLGPIVEWDDRDHDTAARTGSLYRLTFKLYHGWLGSDFELTQTTLDLRHFVSVADSQVLALQLFTRFCTGDAPHQVMPYLGGASLMRGLYAGRFRDRYLYALQAEHRVQWRRRISGVVFASLGDVFERAGAIEPAVPKFAGGAGVRYAINPADRVVARGDIAVASTGDIGFYVELGEAF